MPATPPPVDGISLLVRVQPRSRRPGLARLADGRLRVAVTDPPEDGRANRAVCAAVAQALGVAPTSVSLAGGAASRDKRLHVARDAAALTRALATL